MPLRRYHTPSRVRQTSSASIFAPLVSSITGLRPSCAPIPGPLVETGLGVARVCAVAMFVGGVFGDGDGGGVGVIVGEGEGRLMTGGNGATGTTVFGVVCTAAEVFRVRWLMPM